MGLSQIERKPLKRDPPKKGTAIFRKPPMWERLKLWHALGHGCSGSQGCQSIGPPRMFAAFSTACACGQDWQAMGFLQRSVRGTAGGLSRLPYAQKALLAMMRFTKTFEASKFTSEGHARYEHHFFAFGRSRNGPQNQQFRKLQLLTKSWRWDSSKTNQSQAR